MSISDEISVQENDGVIQNLAEIIREEFTKKNVKVDRLYLFGSRAHGNARSDSDYDFLVISGSQIERFIQRQITSEIRRRFVFEFNIDADILVIPKTSTSASLTDKGKISYYAIRDGIII